MANEIIHSGNSGAEDLDILVRLADALRDEANALRNGSAQASKAKIASLAKSIVLAATGPEELIGGYSVAMGEMAALNQFMEWKIFDLIPDKGVISYLDLARLIQADVSIVARLGGMLVSTGRLIQPHSGHVAHSKTSTLFKSASLPGNLFRVLFDHGLRGFCHWQDYFVEYNNKEPKAVTHNPFTYSWGHPSKSVWEVVDMDEERARVFALAMKSMGSLAGKYGGPANVYDFAWIADAALSFQGPLIVDVGGSHGETLKSILESAPGIPHHRCYLQDRLEVIEEVNRSGLLPHVKTIPHDFMKPNPTTGALIYFVRRVLHDWSDGSCIKILSQLAAAMPDANPHARVLIMEQVVADPPSVHSAAADMIMLNIGGKERTAEGFKTIVEAAGMKIVHIHRKKTSEVGVVECALA